MTRAQSALNHARAIIAQAVETKRRSISLTNMGLRELPEEIGTLTWLEVLEIQSNEIESLPPSITNLTNLDCLYAWKNNICELPYNINNMAKLRWLALGSNSLTKLPDSICHLANIRGLLLDENRIEVLPEDIGRLRHLDNLSISSNSIMKLPRSFGQLRPATVRINNNPLVEPLPSLLKQGIDALFTYLHSLDDGRPQYEAKVLIVGEGEVGKSTLVACLRNDPFIENRATTHGIEINSIRVPHPKLAVSITLNTWDFGGQEVYRITHQFFFGRRCLYILVWNPRQGREANEVEGWIRRIRLRVGTEARIIIVATHCDVRRPELDYPGLQKRFGEILIANQEVDSKSGSGIEALRCKLALAAAKLPQMGEILSEQWIAARDEIMSIQAPQISYSKFEQVCISHGLEKKEGGTLAALLHDLGHIVHYGSDEGLRDIVVLQAEWLTKAIGYVLEDESARRQDGVITHAQLRQVWQTADTNYPPQYHPYFLRLMEKFDVSYRLPDQDSSLIGQLVPYGRPKLPWDDGNGNEMENKGYREIKLLCVMQEEAPGLIAWLTVRNNRFAKGLHWRRGVFSEYAKYHSQALFELLDDRTLSLIVRAPSPDYFLSILRDGVEDLITRRWPGLEYELFTPCGETVGKNECVGKFSLRVLERYRERGRVEIECPECLTTKNVYGLITGFVPVLSPISQALEEFRRSQEEMRADLRRIEVYAADSANHIRAVLRAIADEAADCPRVFTLAPAQPSGAERFKFWEQELVLTLWCEHPGFEHPCTIATYKVRVNKQWLIEVLPYLRLVLKTLRIITSIAGLASTAILDEDETKKIKECIDKMQEVTDKLPGVSTSGSTEVTPSGAMTRAEGAGLRTLRTLLFELDPSGGWGDLRRRLTSSGDYAWVCSEHYGYYDPGLPILPPVPHQ